MICKKALVIRPPDSNIMSYTELRWHLRAWPIFVIDELAWALWELDQSGWI